MVSEDQEPCPLLSPPWKLPQCSGHRALSACWETRTLGHRDNILYIWYIKGKTSIIFLFYQSKTGKPLLPNISPIKAYCRSHIKKTSKGNWPLWFLYYCLVRFSQDLDMQRRLMLLEVVHVQYLLRMNSFYKKCFSFRPWSGWGWLFSCGSDDVMANVRIVTW